MYAEYRPQCDYRRRRRCTPGSLFLPAVRTSHNAAPAYRSLARDSPPIPAVNIPLLLIRVIFDEATAVSLPRAVAFSSHRGRMAFSVRAELMARKPKDLSAMDNAQVRA